jgi:putative hemolysin
MIMAGILLAAILLASACAVKPKKLVLPVNLKNPASHYYTQQGYQQEILAAADGS